MKFTAHQLANFTQTALPVTLGLILGVVQPCLAVTLTPTLIVTLTPSPQPQPSLTPIPTTPTNTLIYLSELLPKPNSGDEWIELYNPNQLTLNLTGWQLWDVLSSPSLVYSFTTETIAATSFLVVPINRKLNDTADGVILKNPQGQIMDQTNYVSAPTDLGWARLSFIETPGDWNFLAASLGLANPIPTQVPTLSLSPTPNPVQPTGLTPTSSIKTSLTPTEIASTQAKLVSSILVSKPKSQSLKTPTSTQPSPELIFSPSPTFPALGLKAKIPKKTDLSQPFNAIMIGSWLMILTSGILGIFSPQVCDTAHQSASSVVSAPS